MTFGEGIPSTPKAANPNSIDMPELIPQDDEYAQRLLNPRWDIVEDHFGGRVPQQLKDFYADPSRVLLVEYDLETTENGNPFEGRLYVLSFDVIDEDITTPYGEYDKHIVLAHDEGDGLYLIEPTEEDPDVFYLYMNASGGLRFTGLCLSSFLSAPRLEPREPD